MWRRDQARAGCEKGSVRLPKQQIKNGRQDAGGEQGPGICGWVGEGPQKAKLSPVPGFQEENGGVSRF